MLGDTLPNLTNKRTYVDKHELSTYVNLSKTGQWTHEVPKKEAYAQLPEMISCYQLP